KIYKFNSEDPQAIMRSWRKDLRANYLFEIRFFKMLKESMLRWGCEPNYIESTEFDAADFTWVLLIYPNGNKQQPPPDHLSLYLKMVTQLDPRYPVKASLKIFIYNFNKEAYLLIEGQYYYDSVDRILHMSFHYFMFMYVHACAKAGKEETYDAINRKRGIVKALRLSEFGDPAAGYIQDDICRIGIEVTIANHVNENGISFGRLFIPQVEGDTSYTWPIWLSSHQQRANCMKSGEINMHGRKW
ncbi:hypothetical protein Ancab_017010, partial [Ancistrocladus abbreviatus]